MSATIEPNPALFTRFALAIAKGGYRTTTAARVFGVSRTQSTRWFQYGQRDIDRGEDTVYSRLVRCCEDAEHDLETRIADTMTASDDWRAVAWMAERRLRDTHGDVKTLAIAPTQTGHVDATTVAQLTTDDVRALAAAAFDLDRNGDSTGGTDGT